MKRPRPLRLSFTESLTSTHKPAMLNADQRGPEMRESSANSLVFKILPASYCGSKIISRFSSKSLIPIDQGGGGRPTSDRAFPFRELFILCLTAVFSTTLFAQAPRGTLVHEETIRVSPSSDTAKLGT